MSRSRVFLRILLRSMLVRPGRTATTLAAIAVASAVITCMWTLYADVQAKLHREFRVYGSNLIIAAKDGGLLPEETLDIVVSQLGSDGMAAPFAYAIADTTTGSPVVVAGADIERTRKLNPWWSVTGWPSSPDSALLGWRAAAAVSPQSRPFDLFFNNHVIHLSVAGTLRTGSAEDSRIYITLADFESWTHVTPSTIEVSAVGSSEQIRRLVNTLYLPPNVQAQPVRRITEAEGRVFEKSRAAFLALVLVITLTSILCVLATLTTSVLDRRKDFAVMKALGATRNMANAFFATEVCLLGAVGGMIGYGAGIVLAAMISWSAFHASVSPRWALLPVILLGSMVTTLLAALAPLAILRGLQPAVILKGE
jgi:putative ABC transport system permease protein